MQPSLAAGDLTPGTLVAAMVAAGPRHCELRELPVPETGRDDALLVVEAAGVCGSDVGMYRRGGPERVLGHENVGVLVNVGDSASRRWGLTDGDRVLLEEYLPCGHCRFCRTSDFRSCLASDTSLNPDAVRFGSTPLSVPPGLWGGYSQVLYVHPRAVAHRVPDAVPSHLATLGLPLGNGYQWAVLDGQARPGECVVVIGPGQAGIGCVVAAKEAGAEVVVVGLPHDGARLKVAAALGADVVLVSGPAPDLSSGDIVERVRAVTDGAMADLVIDSAAGSEDTVGLAVDLCGKHGRIVLAAAARQPLTRFPIWDVSRKQLDIRAVRGHGYRSVEWALALIASGRRPVELMSSYVGGLTDLDYALSATEGRDAAPILHATIIPGQPAGQRQDA